eukprot:scaffold19566_cov132-Skeletonema_dohrnii-CCMP3373.AAC.1
MGRKRNQGKARKAAKAKAREEEEERIRNNNQTNRDNQTTNGQQQASEMQMQQLELGAAAISSGHDTKKCSHGFEEMDNMFIDLAMAFIRAVHDANKMGQSYLNCLIAAEDATKDEFAAVWNDSAKMEIVISFFLSMGTDSILEGNYHAAREFAIYARYFEQHIAVELHQSQAIMHWQKIKEVSIRGDIHTLVKFHRKRIPCACLNSKYEEVKATTKMGICYNPQCNNKDGLVERSKTMYCSRCRCVAYCSRECQKAHWPMHRED